MLLSVFFVLILGGLLIALTSEKNLGLLKSLSVLTTGVVLLISSFLLIGFDKNSSFFQYTVQLDSYFNFYNVLPSFGLDGLSVYFFYLTAILIFLCIIFIGEEPHYKNFSLTLLVIEFFLLVIFSTLDLFLFYVFFEGILIPMFILIGFWGSRARKTRAAYLLFFYTFCSSILMLVGLLYIYRTCGTFSIEYLLAHKFTFEEQKYLWIAFFLSFASKIPMFPFHIWLPEAHVEAPTVGSVLLAGILLKMGVYGFIRFSLTLFPEASIYFTPLVYVLSIIGIIHASMAALRQTDVKRVIAYSSIAHMNLVTLGIFAFNGMGLSGAVLQSVSHGFVSGGLFFLVGIIYSRYHTRFLQYYGGIVHFMPLFSIIFLVFTMANIALPGTANFTGEFLLLTSVYNASFITGVIASLGVILGGGYSLWLCNRILFGNLKVNFLISFKDMDYREFLVMFPLLVFTLVLGIYPTYVLSCLKFLG